MWIIDTFREYPSLAIFLTIGVGFLIGQLKYKGFSLGIVTSVLLVGIVVGQMDISIPGPVKSVFFLMFLFAIGYSVGPQFFRSLKGDGVKQVYFAVLMCVTVLVVTWGTAKLFGYNTGEALGLFSGAQTISAVIGVGEDTIGTLGVSEETKKQWLDMIPVCYAVTYIFGTIGSAYLLGNIGPRLLGGLDKVKAQTAELEKTMSQSSITNDPAFIDASRPVAFRAYKVTSDFFDTPKSVDDIEAHFKELGRRIFVERVRTSEGIAEVSTKPMVAKGDEIVLSGRREFIIEDESWIGPEVSDLEFLSFAAEDIPVMITKKTVDGLTVDQLRSKPFMYGVTIKKIPRNSVNTRACADAASRRRHNRDCRSAAGGDRSCRETRLYRPSDQQDRFCLCGLRNTYRRPHRCADHTSWRCADKPKYERRRSDSGSYIRMAPVEASYFRPHTGCIAMGAQQSRSQHVYSRHRHYRRPVVHKRSERCRVHAFVCGNYSHYPASAHRYIHGGENISFSSGHNAGVLRRRPYYDRCVRSHSGLTQQHDTGHGIHDHLRHRQYSAHHMGRGACTYYVE